MIELTRGIFASAIYYAAVVLDETSLVPLGTIFVVGGGIWWLGRKLQSLEDSQRDISRRLDGLPCNKKDCPVAPKTDV